MPQLDSTQITELQKQFIIFIGEEVCSIGQAEERGLVQVHVDENTGDVAYTELPMAQRAQRH